MAVAAHEVKVKEERAAAVVRAAAVERAAAVVMRPLSSYSENLKLLHPEVLVKVKVVMAQMAQKMLVKVMLVRAAAVVRNSPSLY